jgi:hypothetical protein
MNKNYDFDPVKDTKQVFSEYEDYDFDMLKDLRMIRANHRPEPKFIKTNAPIISEEDKIALEKFFNDHPELKSKESPHDLAKSNASRGFKLRYDVGSDEFYPNEAWIQTFTGKRFTPTNPNPESIVILDIAHALSMQCRFSGHVKKFYSVAQHSVLVSYLCNQEDSLWGLLHDATEAYLVDVPSPLKRSGKFDAYLEFEKNMQTAICKRFGLEDKEPPSVKKADSLLLATEARDLMSPLREDWVYPVRPLPMKIDPLLPEEAELLFLNRFYDLIDELK